MGSFDNRMEGVAFPLVHIATECSRVSDIIRARGCTENALKLSYVMDRSMEKHKDTTPRKRSAIYNMQLLIAHSVEVSSHNVIEGYSLCVGCMY